MITIDIGNSEIKVLVFDNESISNIFRFPTITDCIEFIQKYDSQYVIWCSVKPYDTVLLDYITSKSKYHFIFKSSSNNMLINKYETTSTLGSDRMAAAIGAYTLFSSKNMLVIDAGTCITYDFVTAQKEYLGGAISPGFQMRFNALHRQTAQLPLINEIIQSTLIGTSTAKSISSGVVNGVLFEISGVIESYLTLYPNLEIVICGGNATFIKKNIKKYNLHLEPNLIHYGLIAVLKTMRKENNSKS